MDEKRISQFSLLLVMDKVTSSIMSITMSSQAIQLAPQLFTLTNALKLVTRHNNSTWDPRCLVFIQAKSDYEIFIQSSKGLQNHHRAKVKHNLFLCPFVTCFGIFFTSGSDFRPTLDEGPGSNFLGTNLDWFEANWILELDCTLVPSLILGSPNQELSF